MFRNADDALRNAGYSYQDVARTWIYLPRILGWYKVFNGVRRAHHRRVGLAGPNQRLPASTGIQARSGPEHCLMDVLGVQSRKRGAFRLQAIERTSRQERAAAYGSAFSRGTTLEIEGRKTVHVSGTASIDARGVSIHRGDATAQAAETLMALGSVLEAAGGGLESIRSATVFCKNADALRAFREVTRILRVPRFPHVVVLADVCRPELLIEIEAVGADA